jgi:hypothetical protein
VLGFDLSAIAKTKEWPLSSSDLHSARRLLLDVRNREAHNYDTSYSPEFRGPDQVESHEDTILFRQSDFIRFLEYDKQKPARGYFSVSHLAIPGINYSEAVALEIQGNSMSPRYPDQSRHLLFPVEDDYWQYATGVHAIWLKNKKMFFKRIISNKAGVLVLSTDSNGEQTTIELTDIAALYKAGQAIHLPPEEL